jgi:hypothetical protein
MTSSQESPNEPKMLAPPENWLEVEAMGDHVLLKLLNDKEALLDPSLRREKPDAITYIPTMNEAIIERTAKVSYWRSIAGEDELLFQLMLDVDDTRDALMEHPGDATLRQLLTQTKERLDAYQHTRK